jgi:hypothetical protein
VFNLNASSYIKVYSFSKSEINPFDKIKYQLSVSRSLDVNYSLWDSKRENTLRIEEKLNSISPSEICPSFGHSFSSDLCQGYLCALSWILHSQRAAPVSGYLVIWAGQSPVD